MNIKAAGMACNYMASPFDNVGVHTGNKKPVKEEKAAVYESAEEAFAKQTIEQFQEENDPQAKKIERILTKFKAGKELSQSEMEYLAKHAPEAYQEVCEVMMERKQLEMELKAAKTKLEAMQAYSNALNKISATKGSGDQEKQQAPMTRINHVADVYGKFAAGKEYSDLEDEEDKAEAIRESIEAMESDESTKSEEAPDSIAPEEADKAERADKDDDGNPEAVADTDKKTKKSTAFEDNILNTVTGKSKKRRKKNPVLVSGYVKPPPNLPRSGGKGSGQKAGSSFDISL